MKKYLAAIAIVSGTAVAASDFSDWGAAGAWKILVDPTNGNGCLAQKTFDDGTVIQIGGVPVRKGGFFAAYHADWTDIEAGAAGVLTFDFGDARFAGDVVGKIADGIPGGYAFFDNPAFVDEFAKRNSVKFSGERGKGAEISLAGTTKALAAVRACQKEQPKPAQD